MSAKDGMPVLVIDVGGSHVKILASGQTEAREFESGPTMTAAQMVEGVKRLAADWPYEAVAIGYPGVVMHDQPVTEPHNLASGWIAFDYPGAFGCPVKIINDAAMQALGSFRQGKLLFLGLGTGLGTTLVVDGVVVPMELAHLPYRKRSFEDYVGERALKRDGKKKWSKRVADVVGRLKAAFAPDDVVIGGGNVRHLKELPEGCRAGDNANAFAGGFRLWASVPRAARGSASNKATENAPRKVSGKALQRRRSARTKAPGA
ncbi:MAG: ROK family protein [Gammaproteobacteria bacterium]|nr:ROK family protein [Gammaproteobacteria bacterium]